jgi:DnaJ-domain-containing protein 1
MHKQFNAQSENPVDRVKFIEEEEHEDEELDDEEEEHGKVDYYAVLGVTKTATLQEIKTAFRQLSRDSHPDIQVCISYLMLIFDPDSK